MMDIITFSGSDLTILDTDIKRAENLLGVQLGALTYAPDWGIDLKFFLDDSFQFQNESFKSYLIQRMAENIINVTEITEIIETFYTKYIFGITDIETNDSLVR